MGKRVEYWLSNVISNYYDTGSSFSNRHTILVQNKFLIHEAEPQSGPVVIIIFSHLVHTFHNLAKQNNFQVKMVITASGTLGQAEWIIDNTCLVKAVSKNALKFILNQFYSNKSLRVLPTITNRNKTSTRRTFS